MDAREQALGPVRCDCGAVVPFEDGPTHAYMRAAPACWRMYGEVSAAWYSAPAPQGYSSVDCYAVQHPGGAESDRRQRQSVGVHLFALCLHERGVQGRALALARQRASEHVLARMGLPDWPLLEPPTDLGPITAPAISRTDRSARAALVAGWPHACWAAWSDHHGTVERWVDELWRHR